MKLCLLTTAGNLSVVFNSCARRAGSATEPQKVSGRMWPGEKTETRGRIVNDGIKWPRARKAGAGVSQGDGDVTSQCGVGLEALEVMLSRGAGAEQTFGGAGAAEIWVRRD